MAGMEVSVAGEITGLWASPALPAWGAAKVLGLIGLMSLVCHPDIRVLLSLQAHGSHESITHSTRTPEEEATMEQRVWLVSLVPWGISYVINTALI